MHSLLRYVSRYSEWKPHVVIVMHAFNDIYQSSEGRLTSGRYRDDYGHFFGAMGRRVNPVDHVNGALGRHLRDSWLSRVWFSDFRKSLAEEPRPKVDLLRALPSFRRNLSNIVRRARDDGAAVAVLSQPFIYREQMSLQEQGSIFYSHYYADYAQVPGIEEQKHAMHAFNAASREVALAHGAIFVDLEAMIPKSIDMMYDDVHHTAAGARAVAEAIARSVPWDRVLQSQTVMEPGL
jgi:hypothetical protein